MRCACPICFDVFGDGKEIVAPACGHVFHNDCLSKWFLNSKHCPECRSQVNRKHLHRLYLSSSNNETLDAASLENDLESKKSEIVAKDCEISKLKLKVKELQKSFRENEENFHSVYQKFLQTEGDLNFARAQLKDLDKLRRKIDQLEAQNLSLSKDLEHLNNIQRIVNGTQQEVDTILQQQGEETSKRSITNIASFCSVLKREMTKVVAEKNDLKNQVSDLKMQLGISKAKLSQLSKSHEELQKKFAKQSEVNLSLLSNKSVSCTPVNISTPQPSTSKGTVPFEDLTPISINFSDKKKIKLDVVYLNKEVGSCTSPKKTSSVPELKMNPKLHKQNDYDSITRIGYNGLGGHSQALFCTSKDVLKAKLYKRNPNLKKSK